MGVGYEGPERRQDYAYLEEIVSKAVKTSATEAANKAVSEVMFKLGVDPDDLKSVSDFQKAQRLSLQLSNIIDKGTTAIIISICVGIPALIWLGLKAKIMGWFN